MDSMDFEIPRNVTDLIFVACQILPILTSKSAQVQNMLQLISKSTMYKTFQTSTTQALAFERVKQA